jgi:sec-independent protein translocase protein TatA
MLALIGPIGNTEAIIILIIALLVFGSRLPSVMRSLGKGVVEFKRGLRDVEDDVNRAGEDESHPKDGGQRKPEELTSHKQS